VHRERILLLGLAAVATTATVIQTLRIWWRSFSLRHRLRRRAARAAAGETRATELLERRGYRVLERQVTQQGRILVDGRPTFFDLRADLLVARRGRRYVAEVKTGQVAPSVTHRATRRQLLEYRSAFDVDGALLVNAESGTVQEVEFPDGLSARRSAVVQPILWLALGGVIGALLVRLLG
jgi:hypothetical protein